MLELVSNLKKPNVDSRYTRTKKCGTLCTTLVCKMNVCVVSAIDAEKSLSPSFPAYRVRP